MELIGLMLALPVTLVTSTVFCLLAFWAFGRFPQLRSPVGVFAGIVVGSVVLEIVLSIAFGPLSLHRHLDGLHSVVHFINFILAPPAVACVILVRAARSGTRSVLPRIAAIGVCWFTCMASLLGNIVVDEAIYGIDGSGISPTQTP